jgi:protocatechuate 3,4-dioxygenase alpha subunit
VGDNTFFVVYHPRDQRAVPLDPAFLGFGRTGTDPDGALWFETVKPELVPFDATTIQAPHTCVAVFGRDL